MNYPTFKLSIYYFYVACRNPAKYYNNNLPEEIELKLDDWEIQQSCSKKLVTQC